MIELWRVSVRARGDDAEPLRATLLALAPSGIEEVDLGDTVELAVYVADADVDRALGALPNAIAQPVTSGWEDRWRTFHRPVEAGGLWIGPPWESHPDASRAVVIDPGRAFGTGGHPTTRLCVELLARRTVHGSLLDVGCGSGVLAIAAARLGFAPVSAVDIDPVAVETTIANAAANGVEIDAYVSDAASASLPQADMAMVNVLLRPVEKILARLESRAAITSGYLVAERPLAPGWEHVARRELDGWAADAWARSRRAKPIAQIDRLSSWARMATFSTRFLGCKVSFADAQAIRERLLADGHREVAHGGEIQVVNTCCVTHEAVSKSRQAASRAARSARAVYVTGCASRLERAFDGAAVNVIVTGRTGDDAATFVAGDVGAIGCVNAEHRLDRFRAFVRIQDGCSFSCAFCVIPLVRGGTRSRTAEAVLDEIRRRVAQGHREIVLTGVNLGCFRDRAAGFTLARLVREAGAVPGLERLRLSSIEVNHVDDELVDALTRTPNVSPHLHVPLQSGDDGVLRAMGRRYTSAQFTRRLAPLAHLNLTTDVIVGFPAEDEAAFARTLELVERLGISKVHVFPYSPRPGTRTAAADTVPAAVKRDRGARLRALSDELGRRRWQTRVGTTDRVLVDRPGRGYANDYTPWLVDAPVGAFVTARAVGVAAEGVLAVAA